MKNNTVVITSKENFVWHSMQEIIPQLVDQWESTEDDLHAVSVFCVDDISLKTMIPAIIAADNIVFTCFTIKVAQLAKMIRETINREARFIIHLHGMATIGCWPILKWQGVDSLRESDIFIGTCDGDIMCMQQSFFNATVVKIPFTINDSDIQIPPLYRSEDEISLVYIGRISEQKNLHTLMVAFSVVCKQSNTRNLRLHVFGKEDGLGSPNMDITFSNYQEYLCMLIEQLNISDKVTFHGHIEREAIYNFLGRERYIFVTPTLHSDENFGMAVFRALKTSNYVVATNWGGHKEYVKTFPDLFYPITAYYSKYGPFVALSEMVEQILLVIKKYEKKNQELYKNSDFDRCSIVTKLKKLIVKKSGADFRSLKKTDIILTMLEQEKKIRMLSKKQCRIFYNYEDEVAGRFLKSYGASCNYCNSQNGKEYVLYPWANMEGNWLLVKDPHRGEFQIDLNKENDICDFIISNGFGFYK